MHGHGRVHGFAGPERIRAEEREVVLDSAAMAGDDADGVHRAAR